MNRAFLLTLLGQVAIVSAAFSFNSPPEVDPFVRKFYNEPDPAETKTSTLILTVKSPPHLGSHQDVLENLEKSTTFLNREHRLNAVVQTLRNYTAQSQRDLLSFLREKKGSDKSTVEIEALWVTNKVIVKGVDSDLFAQLVQRSDLARIDADKYFPVSKTIDKENRDQNQGYRRFLRSSSFNNGSLGQDTDDADELQWGVKKVRAPEAWSLGITGKGIVIAIIDTGVRATHKLLKTNFRSDRGWFDTQGSLEPIDEHSHGTHCTGTAAGTGGIGVAKEAQWIHCRAGVRGFAVSNTLKCSQWVSCPTDAKGQNEDCSKAAHVVSISIGGGGGNPYMDDVVRTWISQNIVPVIAMGNEGDKGCKSQMSPGDNPDAIGVGATSHHDDIAYFSGRGPNERGGIKPDVSAPGWGISSASNADDDSLKEKSGTSMATPHVAGIAALMLSNNPSMTYAQVKAALTKGCDPVPPSGKDCGGIKETTVPNHISGYGRVNVIKAMGK